MTQFANTPGIPKEDADKLFAAGVSFLSNKAFSSAYVCFDRIPAKDFKLLYNKALCCFMVDGTMSATGCFVKPNALSP